MSLFRFIVKSYDCRRSPDAGKDVMVRKIRIVLAAPFALLAISFDWMSARMEECYDAISAADEATGPR